MTDNHDTPGALRLPLVLLLSALTAWLGFTVLGLGPAPGDIVKLVGTNLDASGVSNPVTAVLLNFRGYDTLLEMAVLLLALIGVWSLGETPLRWEAAEGTVLMHLPRLLVPVLTMAAGYLLWNGAHAPGGAFQAGSVLGAAGVLLLLSSGDLAARFMGLPLRVLLVTGLGLFVIAGLGMLTGGNQFLEYPLPLAASMILIIEATATLSIAATLAALFLGGRPGG